MSDGRTKQKLDEVISSTIDLITELDKGERNKWYPIMHYLVKASNEWPEPPDDSSPRSD